MANEIEQTTNRRQALKAVFNEHNQQINSMKKENTYEAPQTEQLEVELEEGFMKASVYEGGTENAQGVTIEEHGFANGGEGPWEGNYSDSSWD